ncbi:MAG TPA: glycosyltransferase family 39 protein [Kofleriaceae bacterium]|nr:glycosyltransferase family 39 protein [Kofleriaceae bacterium]
MTDPGAVRVTAEPLAGLPRGPGLRRLWILLPLAIAAGLIALRGFLHEAPLDRLARAAGDPADPPGATAYAGSIAIERGGPVIVGFQAAAPGRLTVAGQELRGPGPDGVATLRIVLPRGPAPVRFAAPPGARLVWSPVGRRGPPEYVPASSLSPEPPERATFTAPGRSPLDGAIGQGLLVTLVASLAGLARRRLAAVSRNQWLAMAGVLAVGLAVRLAGLGDAGQTWDEDTNWAAGRNYLTNLLELDFSAAAWRWNYEHPPVMKLLAGIGAQFADGFGPARAMSALWSALGCALLVPIGTRLYRFRVGVLAALIAALLPPMIAHGQIVGHEAPTVLWWSLGILLALGVHDYLPFDARGLRTLRLRLAWVGIVIGVAISSRFVNGLLGPLCALIVVVQAPERWRKATLAWGAVLLPLLAVVTFYALWPRLWADPLGALGASLDRLDTRHGPEPFLGELTEEPARYYFAVYLAATLPAGLLAGVVAWIARAARERDRAALIVLAWLIVPLAVALSPVRQDGVRYVMPCLAALALMAAAGIDAIAAAAAGLAGRASPGASQSMRLARGRLPFLALAAAAAAYLGVTAARTAPYYLDYYGEHVGGAGTVAARRWFEVAWWGEGLDRAVAYVNAHAAPGAPVHRECVAPGHLTWFRDDLWAPMTRDPREAAWIVVYAPAARGCPVPPDATKVHEVVHDGAVLAAVYRRGP